MQWSTSSDGLHTHPNKSHVNAGADPTCAEDLKMWRVAPCGRWVGAGSSQDGRQVMAGTQVGTSGKQYHELASGSMHPACVCNSSCVYEMSIPTYLRMVESL